MSDYFCDSGIGDVIENLMEVIRTTPPNDLQEAIERVVDDAVDTMNGIVYDLLREKEDGFEVKKEDIAGDAIKNFFEDLEFRPSTPDCHETVAVINHNTNTIKPLRCSECGSVFDYTDHEGMVCGKCRRTHNV